MRLDRRKALKLLGLGAVSPAAASPIAADPAQSSGHFRHGVAAGDPTPTGCILWTRITPVSRAERGRVSGTWIVASDQALRQVVSRGGFTTGPDRDYTVKVDADGLAPGRDYWYQFRVGPRRSPIGRTRTLPQGPLDDLVLAVATCSRYEHGLFNAYDAIARLPRVDAVVHLGDYIYEESAANASGRYRRWAQRARRNLRPAGKAITLADYRARHALYKTDPDLQAAHARAPWICVWDDHEVANDCWIGGAPEHDPKTDGPWSPREAAAVRAYYEWMPIREPQAGKAFEAINRSFQFGDLASLIMLESRLVARVHQISYANDVTFRTGSDGRRVPDMDAFRARLDDPSRQMLGTRQEAWLTDELNASVAAGRPWQVLGNQVVMGQVIAPDIKGMLGPAMCDVIMTILPPDQKARAAATADLFAYRTPYNLDAWDGYPAARERVYAACRAARARPIVVSGDSHAFWANDLADAKGQPVGVELGVAGVTSPGICDVVPALPINRFIEDANPSVRFTDHGAKGFVRLTLTRTEAIGELMAVSTVEARPYALKVLKRYRVSAQPDGTMSSLIEV